MIDNGLVGMVLFASRDNRSSGTGYQATARAAWRLTTPATTASTTTPSPTMPRSGWSIRGDENQASRNRALRNADGMIVIGNNNVVTRNHITDAPGCPEDGEVGCGVGISFEGGTGNLIAHNFVTGARNAGIRVAAFEPETPRPRYHRAAQPGRDGDVDGIRWSRPLPAVCLRPYRHRGRG